MYTYNDGLEKGNGTDTAIRRYQTSRRGFVTVLKGRYSIFIIHEVDINGRVAVLDLFDLPIPPAARKLVETTKGGGEKGSGVVAAKEEEKEKEKDGGVDVADKMEDAKLPDVDSKEGNW